MSGFIGGGNTSRETKYTGLQVQTSAQGVPIAMVWGKKRMGVNLVWAGDFASHDAGGKKGGKGGKGSGIYVYSTAVVMALGEGVGNGWGGGIGLDIGTVWADKDITTLSKLGLTLFTGSDTQAPWSYLTTNHPTEALSYAYTAYVAASSYSLGNSPTLPNHNFEVIRTGFFDYPGWSYPGSNDSRMSGVIYDLLTNPQYGISLPTSIFDFDTFGVQYSGYTAAQGLWFSPSIETQEQLSSILDRWAQLSNTWIFFSGNVIKAVPLGEAAISNASSYTTKVYTTVPNDPGPYAVNLLGASANGGVVYQQTGTALTDVTPSGTPGQGQYSTSFTGNGQWLFNSKDAGKAVIITATISPIGNYTPDVTPLFDLSYDFGLVVNGTDPPIDVDRADPADLVNHVRLEYKNRNNAYNTAIADWMDDGLVREFGRIDHPVTEAHEICDPVVAQMVARLMGQRACYIRNTYTFTVIWWLGSYLEPGDFVTLTDPHIGISLFPVRIRTLEEDDAGNWTVVAEEYTGTVGDVSGVVTTTSQVNTVINTKIDPGNVNPPGVFEPSSNLTGGQAQLWVAASGGPNWGGCVVFVSFDGVNYTEMGVISTPAAQGVLTTSLPNHTDPDTANSFGIDTTISDVALNNDATHADADAFRTLALIQPVYTTGIPGNGECVAYGSVVITGAFTDTLSYLRRGLYGTTPALHNTGDYFTRFDLSKTQPPSNSVLVWNIPPQYIGQTLHLKFASFNNFGNSLQSLSSVTDYTYVPTGAGYGGGGSGVPTTPTGLTATPGYGSVTLSWSPNPTTDNVQKYNVYRAPGLSQPFGSASLLATTTGTSYTDNGLAASTGWTYFIKAVNAAGTSAASSGVNATVLTGGAGTVTSVAISSADGTIAVNSGSPITGAGTIDLSVGQIRYDMSTYYIGVPGNSEVIMQWEAVRAVTIPAGGGTSKAKAKTASTGSAAFTIAKNGVSVGTITWTAGVNAGSFTIGSTITLAAGDELTITGPSTADATLAGISVTLAGKA